ncbi:MAG TPA: DUF4872 domain-containing protein [Candidatus Limnocylindrales bacterium]|nr:DUF4872 domain-containing protein [Candidatus Limnocylindrales bacterium]
MTRHPHLKERIRARMAKTGERYAVARDHVIGAPGGADPRGAPGGADPRGAPGVADPSLLIRGTRHLPGVHPESTALRIVATHASVSGPDGEPLSEAITFVVGGGVGIGVFQFVYEKEDFASFFVGGGHRWDDARAVLEAGARRLGLEPDVVESGGARQAAVQLEAATADGPAVAWVDIAELGTRGYPAEWSGGGYHVLVVYGRDDGGTWLVGDLAPEPIALAPEVLARARARIAKQRHRLMTVARPAGDAPTDLADAVRSGLRATVDGLRAPRSRNFGLAALADWSDRLEGHGRDSWSRAFPRGRRLWNGLTFLHQFVECHGTGGGLLRPLFAAGLREAADTVALDGLRDAADRYAALGEAWTDLAHAALPDGEPLLREARDIQADTARHYLSAGPMAAPDIRRRLERLVEIGGLAAADFPLSEAEVADLRTDLARRVRAIHAAEVAALDELASIVGASA